MPLSVLQQVNKTFEDHNLTITEEYMRCRFDGITIGDPYYTMSVFHKLTLIHTNLIDRHPPISNTAIFSIMSSPISDAAIFNIMSSSYLVINNSYKFVYCWND